MLATSSNPNWRDVLRTHGKAVWAALGICLLLAGCSDFPGDPPTSPSWTLPGPDNTST